MATAAAPASATPPAIDPVHKRALELIEDLIHDKDLGPGVRKAAKAKFPDIRIPEDDVEPLMSPLRAENETLKQRLAAIEEARETEKKEREEARTRRTLEESIDAARSKFSLTDDGVAKMLERMRTTGNYADAEAAAAWVAQQTPPAPPPGPTWMPKSFDNSSLFGTNDADKLKLLHLNPQEYQDGELREFARDPDAYVKRYAA